MQAQVLVAAGGTVDLQWLVDQTSKVWFSGCGDESLSRIANQAVSLVPFDAWVEVLSGYLLQLYLNTAPVFVAVLDYKHALVSDFYGVQ